jgi:hypothetical protein
MDAEGVLSAMVTLRDAVALVPLAGVITGVAAGVGVGVGAVEEPPLELLPEPPHPQTSARAMLIARKLRPWPNWKGIELRIK